MSQQPFGVKFTHRQQVIYLEMFSWATDLLKIEDTAYLVGPGGSGKSLLTDLLMRHLDDIGLIDGCSGNAEQGYKWFYGRSSLSRTLKHQSTRDGIPSNARVFELPATTFA